MKGNEFTDYPPDAPPVPERGKADQPTRADRFVAESQDHAQRAWRRFLFRSFIPLACVFVCGVIAFTVGVVGLANLPPGVPERTPWGVVMVTGMALAILGGALTMVDLGRFQRGGPCQMQTPAGRENASTTAYQQPPSQIRRGGNESTQR
jgi:hypothetical protein